MTSEILDAISGEVYGVWFLIGAALVFWMQAGFAMVETGFTRAKNAGNILMKNLMDFCIGTVVFILLGFGLLLGEDMVGLIGKPGFDIFTDYANFDWSNFVFNLVFCATTATIVSGAMAERTKFISYCVYSAIISAVIYPIEAHWTWGGGWLAQMGFHDFAGSNCIHMVGGICALIGAAILGPRIGKFVKGKDGKVEKVNAFPGHNLPIGCLGVFILWLGWYGFNGAAATTVSELGSIFVTTTIAPAVATVVAMIITWVKYGKPDVSMCLNASLAFFTQWIANIISYLTVCIFITMLTYFNQRTRMDRKNREDVSFGKIFKLSIYARVIFELVETIGVTAGSAIFTGMAWMFISYFGSYQLLLAGFMRPEDRQKPDEML